MQVVQTLGLPPNHGKMYLAMIGCTWKSKNALTKIVVANKKNVNRFKGIEFTEANSVAKREGVNRTCDPQVQNPTPKSEPTHLPAYLSERKDERIACTLSTITIAPSEPSTRSFAGSTGGPRPAFVTQHVANGSSQQRSLVPESVPVSRRELHLRKWWIECGKALEAIRQSSDSAKNQFPIRRR